MRRKPGEDCLAPDYRRVALRRDLSQPLERHPVQRPVRFRERWSHEVVWRQLDEVTWPSASVILRYGHQLAFLFAKSLVPATAQRRLMRARGVRVSNV